MNVWFCEPCSDDLKTDKMEQQLKKENVTMKEELKEGKEINTTICDKINEFEKILDRQNPEQSPRPRRWEENGKEVTQVMVCLL